MKKFTAIFIVTAYLFSTTELHQLLKLPVVFQHYYEHKQLNNDISFLDFLDMHYMHGSPLSSDYAQDMQLPFKTIDKCVGNVVPVIVPQNVNIAINLPVQLKKRQRFIMIDDFMSSFYLSSIWQPPKSC